MPSWTPGSLHKSKENPEENWRRQWAMVCRWYDRIKKIQPELKERDITPDDFDFIIAFFQSCYHFRDWLSVSRPDLQSEVNQLFQEKFELRVLRDICNGTKHCDITKPSIDPSFEFFREYDHLSGEEGWAATTYNILVGEDELKKLELFEFAKSCAFCIQDFLVRKSLISSP